LKRLRRPSSLFPFSLTLLCLALLPSCGTAADFATLLRGNARYREGRFEEAAASYLSVRTGSWATLVDFDLANAWARLGEYKAAVELYAKAIRGGDTGLRRAAWYNLGLLHYEKGAYEAAWGAFKEALRLEPSDLDTRRNLEIAWRDWQKEGRTAPSGLSPTAPGPAAAASEELQFLRRLETGAWRPGAGAETPPDGRDY